MQKGLPQPGKSLSGACVVGQLVEGAEAKAYYGLAVNYPALEALVERLLVKETLSGNEVPLSSQNLKL